MKQERRGTGELTMGYDYCYECSGYGDDYYINDDGELELRCPECCMNPDRDDEDD